MIVGRQQAAPLQHPAGTPLHDCVAARPRWHAPAQDRRPHSLGAMAGQQAGAREASSGHLRCRRCRRDVLLVGAAGLIASATLVGACPKPAWGNPEVLSSLQRYKQRQFVEGRGPLSPRDIRQAYSDWELTLAMVTQAADAQDLMYLRAALQTGVLDFPALETIKAQLLSSEVPETEIHKAAIVRFQQAVQALKADVASGKSFSTVLEDAEVACAALKPLTDGISRQPATCCLMGDG